MDNQLNGILKTHLVLINSKNKASEANSVWLDQIQAIHKHFDIQQATAVLIRPDKYIGLTQMPVQLDELLHYMEKDYINKANKN